MFFFCFRGYDLFCHFIFVFFFTIVDGGMGWGQCCQWPKRHVVFSIFERDVSCVLRWWENVAALKTDLFLSILFLFHFRFLFASLILFSPFFYDVLLSLIFSLHWPMWVCQNGLHRLFASWLIPFSAAALKLSSFFPLLPCLIVRLAWLDVVLFPCIPFLTFVSISSSSFFFGAITQGNMITNQFPIQLNMYEGTDTVWWNGCDVSFVAICFSLHFSFVDPLYFHIFSSSLFSIVFFLLQRMFLNLLFVLSHSVLFLSLTRESSCYNLLFPSILMLPFIRRSLFTLIYFFPFHCVS